MFPLRVRAHLYPCLRLLKRGVCGRVCHRVMLMRRSYVCNRTCHWRRGSALPTIKSLEKKRCVNSSSVPRYSTKIRREPCRSARSPPSAVGVPAAAAAPARRTNQFLHSGVAPVGVCGQTTTVSQVRINHTQHIRCDH